MDAINVRQLTGLYEPGPEFCVVVLVVGSYRKQSESLQFSCSACPFDSSHYIPRVVVPVVLLLTIRQIQCPLRPNNVGNSSNWIVVGCFVSLLEF